MEPTSSQLLQSPLTIKILTQQTLSAEKRLSAKMAPSSDDAGAGACTRKNVNGTNPPIHPPAAHRCNASPNAPRGCAGAAAAWLIQASEIRRTTLKNQKNREY